MKSALGLALVAPADYQAKVVRMGPALHTLLYSGRKGERAPALGGCPLFLDGRLGPLPHGWYHHDGDGPGWGQRPAGDAEGGAYTIGQDKDSCVVYGMPMVAHDIGAVTVQASCDNIASVLMNHLNNR